MSFARVRALVVVGALVVCAVVFVSFALFKDRQRDAPAAQTCPKDAVIADLRLPAEKEIKINVIDASGGTVEAGGLGGELAHRGFQVNVVKSAGTPVVNDVAILGYGPKGVGGAWVVQAQFFGKATSDFQLKRADNTVDLTIGSAFKKLATISEVKGSLGQLGRPTLPPGTCSDDAVA